MLESVLVRDMGNKKFVISQEDTYSFHAAVYNGEIYVSITDIAKCCGFKAPGKVAQRSSFDGMVKLDTRISSGARGLNVSMWYITLDDAVCFVKERSMRDSFSNWFLKEAVRELRNLDTPQQPVEMNQTMPMRGNSVSLTDRIDRLIVELLSLKQEIS